MKNNPEIRSSIDTLFLILAFLFFAEICDIRSAKAQTNRKNPSSALQSVAHDSSENIQTCGSHRINLKNLQMAKDYESSNNQRVMAFAYTVRVFFHICRKSDGSDPASTPEDIESEYQQLLTNYNDGNICFINMGYDYINSTLLYDMDKSEELFLSPYLIANCINIFCHNSVTEGTDVIGGTAYAIPNTYCSINIQNMGNGSTTSHEVGHCLGLYHTHETHGATSFENINGSNSSSSADYITDTEADPNAYSDQSCFSSGNCLYSGTCTDPTGASNFTPPYTNIMSYWRTECPQPPQFTPGQFFRMSAFLMTHFPLLDCISLTNETLGPFAFYNSGTHIESASSDLLTMGSIAINGIARVYLAAKHVILNPGFIADATSGATIIIRSHNCGSSSAKTLKIVESQRFNGGNARLIKCYPNPFRSNVTLEVESEKDAQYVIKLYNLQGESIQNLPPAGLHQGYNNIQLELGDLISGTYIVTLDDGLKIYRSTLIKL